MGSLSPWHLLIIAVIALLLFGRNIKLSAIMGDAAKGIKAFREGLKDDHPETTAPAPTATTLPGVEKDKDPVAR